ncbi:MAG TPA: prepilin-type N-terminal cleavage/methylation domain-containing protein [Sedimentisphaerales bacterium]|nr:prepilin-type N-terminal cleavage/methylation domain-containing protein [Sedimentisphaerales bacterium]
MRKGFSLTEMLAVIVIFPAVTIALDGLFTTILRDIPHSSQVVQENTSVLDVLEHIQDDIDRAKSLPASFADRAADANTLLIELGDGTIAYELENGRVVRRTLGETKDSSTEQAAWSLPNADVEWRVCSRDGAGYAVEIETHIKYKRTTKSLEKMAGTRIYFVGALGEKMRQKNG